MTTFTQNQRPSPASATPDHQSATTVNMAASSRPLITCDICNKSFSRTTSLTRHYLSVHRKRQRYICPVNGCKYRSDAKYNVSRHLRRHKLSEEELKRQLERGFSPASDDESSTQGEAPPHIVQTMYSHPGAMHYYPAPAGAAQMQYVTAPPQQYRPQAAMTYQAAAAHPYAMAPSSHMAAAMPARPQVTQPSMYWAIAPSGQPMGYTMPPIAATKALTSPRMVAAPTAMMARAPPSTTAHQASSRAPQQASAAGINQLLDIPKLYAPTNVTTVRKPQPISPVMAAPSAHTASAMSLARRQAFIGMSRAQAPTMAAAAARNQSYVPRQQAWAYVQPPQARPQSMVMPAAGRHPAMGYATAASRVYASSNLA